jgi:S-formylglutathione hydrolase FrmB
MKKIDRKKVDRKKVDRQKSFIDKKRKPNLFSESVLQEDHVARAEDDLAVATVGDAATRRGRVVVVVVVVVFDSRHYFYRGSLERLSAHKQMEP